MTDEPTLFDAPVLPISGITGRPVAKARNTDPESSHEAAAGVDVTKGQSLILRAARVNDRATAEDLMWTVKRNGQNISPSGARTRCRELCDLGLMKRVAAKPHAIYTLTSEGRIEANKRAKAGRRAA